MRKVKFEFNGLSFDTIKPVYVLGHYIKEPYFFISDFSERNINYELRMLKEYGAKCKRKFVRTISFSGNAENNNELVSISFSPNERKYRNNEIVIGHSPKECLRIFKEKYLQMGGKNEN